MGVDALSAAELAKRFGVHQGTICRWVDDGILPKPITGPRKHGRLWDRDAIERLESKGRVPNTGELFTSMNRLVQGLERLEEVKMHASLHPAWYALAKGLEAVLYCITVPLEKRCNIASQILNDIGWHKGTDPSAEDVANFDHATKEVEILLRNNRPKNTPLARDQIAEGIAWISGCAMAPDPLREWAERAIEDLFGAPAAARADDPTVQRLLDNPIMQGSA